MNPLVNWIRNQIAYGVSLKDIHDDFIQDCQDEGEFYLLYQMAQMLHDKDGS